MTNSYSTNTQSAHISWAEHYQNLGAQKNYCPENFVARIFLSESPVNFIENKNYKDKKLLDLGCGHGRHIPFLSGLGFDVTGLEVSDAQIARLKSDFPHNRFIAGTASQCTIQSQSFDYILACNSIYYLDNSNSLLDDHFTTCTRALKHSGMLIFSLLGHMHSLLLDSEKLPNGNAIITRDSLGFRNRTVLRPLWEQEKIENLIPSSLHITKSGEILEKSEGFVRHLHYFVAKNREIS